MIAYCNIGFTPTVTPRRAPPFAGEGEDLQVALATRIGGRLRRAPEASRGGFFDLLDHFLAWEPDYAIGAIETPDDQPSEPAGGDLRLMMTTGRRPSGIIDDRKGLATGWHDVSRAWWSDQPRPMSVMFAQGICELLGVIKGDSIAFLELFDDAPGAVHVVYVNDGPIVPSARQLLEQIRRTPEESAIIANDLMQALASGGITPTPADWIFAGIILNTLQRSPIGQRYDVIGRAGLGETIGPDVVLLTANGEPSYSARHKTLDYALHCHQFRMGQAGPAIQRWYTDAFTFAPFPIEAVAADYRALVGEIRARWPNTLILVCNAMSSRGEDDIHTYAAFDAPMGASLETVRSKDINLMLHDLAAELDIVIVDADAIATELGGQRSIPDGVHQNGAMQREVRAEVLRILRARGVPGFAPVS